MYETIKLFGMFDETSYLGAGNKTILLLGAVKAAPLPVQTGVGKEVWISMRPTANLTCLSSMTS
jgi:hypothetical protein